jgi:hypothetical protein
MRINILDVYNVIANSRKSGIPSKELSSKFKVSKKTIQSIIRRLREKGYEIAYKHIQYNNKKEKIGGYVIGKYFDKIKDGRHYMKWELGIRYGQHIRVNNISQRLINMHTQSQHHLVIQTLNILSPPLHNNHIQHISQLLEIPFKPIIIK